MITVYKICNDVDRYQSLRTDDSWVRKIKDDGRPLKRLWKAPPKTYAPNPKLNVPDFWAFDPLLSGFVVSLALYESIPLLGKLGEALPLDVVDHESDDLVYYSLKNIVDCLDKEKSKWDPEINWIDKFVFKARLLKGPLFKIPQHITSEMYVVEGLLPPEKEFRAIVESRHLTGIDFKKVWRGKK